MKQATWAALILAAGIFSTRAAGTPDAENGRQLFTKVCATCHGTDGEGRVVGGQPFPTIAGLPSWYVEQQLRNFQTDVRGAHGRDSMGLLMRPIARSIESTQMVADVAAYIGKLRRAHPGRTVEDIVIRKQGEALIGRARESSGRAEEITIEVAGGGVVTVSRAEIQKLAKVSLEHGATLYQKVCASCHGQKFEGSLDPAIRAPSQRPLCDWYMLRQLKNFSAGIRGTNPKDAGGAKMVPIAKDVLRDMGASLNLSQEEASASVVAYIFASRDLPEAAPVATAKP